MPTVSNREERENDSLNHLDYQHHGRNRHIHCRYGFGCAFRYLAKGHF